MTRHLLWICSAQKDFLPGGALAIPAAKALPPVLGRLVEDARRTGRPILRTVILRQPDDPPLAPAPASAVHALMEGSEGQREIPQAAHHYGPEIPRRVRSRRGVRESLNFQHQEVLVEVPGYDPWEHPQLGTVLEAIAPLRVLLCGVPAELSVAAAARGLSRRGLPFDILEEATCPLDPARWAEARRELQRLMDAGSGRNGHQQGQGEAHHGQHAGEPGGQGPQAIDEG
ncbi:MAG: isochorismatase family protein [Acidobacteriota bacterium]|nr:isochorismatase family protein [Acidobacteriota bacterium]MDQ7088992.1 isochorismatase family protein [Acidobacteriota bacterium]